MKYKEILVKLLINAKNHSLIDTNKVFYLCTEFIKIIYEEKDITKFALLDFINKAKKEYPQFFKWIYETGKKFNNEFKEGEAWCTNDKIFDDEFEEEFGLEFELETEDYGELELEEKFKLVNLEDKIRVLEEYIDSL